jgi:large subunit ribosomal protein L4
VDRLEFETVKTRRFVEVMEALKIRDTLIVTDHKIESLELSSRNVPYVKVLRSEGLNVYDVLRFKNLILLEPSVKQITERLAS